MFLRNLTRSSARLIPRLQPPHRHLTHVPLPSRTSSILPTLTALPSKTVQDYNQLLAQLASDGRSEQAQSVYDHIFRHDLPATIDTYSQLILAYLNDDQFEDAMGIYYKLRDHEGSVRLRLDASTYQVMISALTRPTRSSQPPVFGDAEPIYAYTVSDPDSYLYPDLDGESDPALLTALTLFNDMRQLDIRPTVEMYRFMLKACAEQRDGYVLEKVHRLIRMDLYLDPDRSVYQGLMEAYRALDDVSGVLDVWDVLKDGWLDQEGVSVVLETCLKAGYYTRAEAVWCTAQAQGVRSVEIFNLYLSSLLKRQQLEKAKGLLENALLSGEADQSSQALYDQFVQPSKLENI